MGASDEEASTVVEGASTSADVGSAAGGVVGAGAVDMVGEREGAEGVELVSVEVVEEGERNRQLDAEVFETAPRPRARQDCNLLRQKHAYTSAETRP